MMDDQSVVYGVQTPRAIKADCFGARGPAQFTSIPGRRILKLLCNAHQILCLALVIGTFDLAVGLALACYGITIGLVLVALRMTHDRNMRFSMCDELREG